MRNMQTVLMIAAISLACLSGITLAQETVSNGSKQVQLYTQSVELVEVVPSAAQCDKQKGTSLRLKVNSESPVDVRLYVQTGYKRWLPRDFPNQRLGDVITDHMCREKANYKVYARAAGSSEAWPKP